MARSADPQEMGATITVSAIALCGALLWGVKRPASRRASGALLGLAAAPWVYLLLVRRGTQQGSLYIPPFLDAVRQFNRSVLNPTIVRLAGKPHIPLALVRHRGRRSGRMYTTPLDVGRFGSRIYIPMTYGPGCDWCRNILAEGGCTLVIGGTERKGTIPEVVGLGEARQAFTAPVVAAFRLFRVRDFMRLELS
jgi:deazaflavin-dependent oxidoreductase (nitroreductase family)